MDKQLTVNVHGDFNVVRLREEIAEGQRVDAFAADGFIGGEWKPLAEGTSIGACRILRLDAVQTARKVRLRVLRSSAEVRLKELGVYRESV